jgi:alanyl-tRNA synthetase
MLSSLDKDLLTKVKKLYDDKNALEKETRELREDLNKIKGDEFLKSAKQNEKVNFIVKILENTSLLEVSFISSYLNNNNKNLVQIYGLKSQDKGQFYITKTKDVNINLLDTYKDVSSKVNIKGGGNPNSIQGAIEVDDIENATNLFYKEFVNELAV